jgi:tRNA modification GTPase
VSQAETISQTDTIVAIATAIGPAGVGIVRLSGSDAFTIAAKLTHKSIDSQPTHTLKRATIYEISTNEVLDDGLVAIFRAPKTFTGENIVEFQGHGGSLVLNRVLDACLSAGARLARPGEFSERAFLNGKLDLTQAEAIADLISARSITAGRAARRHLSGALTQSVESISHAIRNALARIEASIDFPEEVGEIDPELVGSYLQDALNKIQKLLQTAKYGRSLTEGITVAIIGRPNVGKSSLLNYLSGTERAIVSDIPGTTRDIVSESLILGGVPVRLLDTAGIRETLDPIEKIGVERSQNALKDADVILYVRDASEEDSTKNSAIDIPTNMPLITLWNKSDLAKPENLTREGVALSCLTGEGFDALHHEVTKILSGSVNISDSDVLITRARQENSLREAEKSLINAINTLQNNLPPEIIAVDAHASLQHLGEISGITSREEVIKGIFATFCIGK